jgi:hypothetical protein
MRFAVGSQRTCPSCFNLMHGTTPICSMSRLAQVQPSSYWRRLLSVASLLTTRLPCRPILIGRTGRMPVRSEVLGRAPATQPSAGASLYGWTLGFNSSGLSRPNAIHYGPLGRDSGFVSGVLSLSASVRYRQLTCVGVKGFVTRGFARVSCFPGSCDRAAGSDNRAIDAGSRSWSGEPETPLTCLRPGRPRPARQRSAAAISDRSPRHRQASHSRPQPHPAGRNPTLIPAGP